MSSLPSYLQYLNSRESPITELILASSSPFRRELLERLQIPFQCYAPEIDESALANETLDAQVTRLAVAKARALADQHRSALIIGSDQLAICEGKVFGKPGDYQKAAEQLRFISGRSLLFKTGLCLLNTDSAVEQVDCVEYRVHFRDLSEQEIQRYLEAEQPFNCAGSFKSEALGISLVQSMDGSDPSALIGLPLISLAAMLRNEGLNLP